MDLVDAIAAEPTGVYSGMRDVPKEQVIIEYAEVHTPIKGPVN